MSLRTSIAKYVLNLVRINVRENVQLLVLFFLRGRGGGANPLGAGDISETRKYRYMFSCLVIVIVYH